MAEDKDYSLFQKAKNVISNVAASDTGTIGEDSATSMIDAPGSGGGILPIRILPKTASEPAVTGKKDVTFTPDMMGMQFKESVRNVLDKSKITPIVSVEEAYTAKGVDVTGDAFKNAIMSATGFSSKNRDAKSSEDGTTPTQDTLFFKADSYESRLQKLNMGNAVNLNFSLTNKQGQVRTRTQPIPYDAITSTYTTMPADIDAYMFNLNPLGVDAKDIDSPKAKEGLNLFTTTSLNSDYLKVGVARNFVNNLRGNGVSERNIAGILKHRMSLPSGKGLGFGDASNYRGLFTDVVRMGFEAGGYLVGEGMDAVSTGVDQFLSQSMPMGVYEKLQKQLGLEGKSIAEESLSKLTLGLASTDAIEREAFHDRFMPRMAGFILNRYDQLGLDISYEQAERLSRMYSGLPAKTVAVAAEVRLGTTAAKQIKYIAGRREMALFKKFADDTVKKYPDARPEDVIQRYESMRRTQFFGGTFLSSTIHDKALKVPVIGGALAATADAVSNPLSFINGIRTSSSLMAGMQIEEAALSVKNRPEVVKYVKYRAEKRAQRIALQNRAADENRPLTMKEQDRLDSLNLDLERSSTQLRRIIADSSVPQFMRQSNTIDNFTILMGATAATTAEIHGGDGMLWEFIGSMGGLVVGGGIEGRGTAKAVMKYLLAGRQKGRGGFSRLEVMQGNKLAENLSRFDPTFRDAVMERADYFDSLSQSLVGEGVAPEVLERSASNVLNLSVLQTLEESIRVSLDAPGAAGFSEASMLLEQNRGMQQTLVSELRGLLGRLSSSDRAMLEGTATNKLYTTVNAAVENATGKIAQLDADLKVLNTNYESMVLNMIEGTPGGAMSQLSPDGEKNMAEVFKRLYTEHGIEQLTPQNAARIKEDIDEKASFTFDSIKQAASNTATEALPTTPQARRTTAELLESKPRDLSPRSAVMEPGENLPLFQKPSDLFALLLESSYAADNANASLPYKSLDSQLFFRVAPDGQKVPVVGDVYSDGGVILDTVLDAINTDDGAELATLLNPNTIGQSQVSKILTSLSEVSTTVLANAASDKGVEVADLIETIVETANAKGTPLNSKIPVELAAVNFMRKEAAANGVSIDVFPLNFTQLKELRETFNNLQYSAARSGKGGAQNTYTRLTNDADTAFASFVVREENGNVTDASNLMATITLPDGSQSDMTVTDGLATARRGYSEHLARYKDEELIRNWMGFKDFGNGARNTRAVSADYPLGMNYGKNKTSSWINVKEWAGLDSNTQADRLRAIANVIGVDTVVLTNDVPSRVKRIDISTPKGKAFQEVLGAHYREFILEQFERGDLSFEQFDDISKSFEKAFMGIDETGKEIRLIDSDRMFNKVMSFSETSVGKQKYELGRKQFKDAAAAELTRVTNEARVVRKGLSSSVDFLSGFSSVKVDAENLAQTLIAGGPTRIGELKNHLMTAGKLTEDETSFVLRTVLSEAIEQKAFKSTNTFIPDVNSGRVTERFEVDINEFGKLLGVGNREVADAVENLVGEKNYKIYKNILNFMSEEQAKVRRGGVNFTGVPRSFSVESYISRFYAVNRGVVSFRYVGTEAALQQMRNRNMTMLTQMISNPKVGEYFLEMMRTGQPLPYEKEKEFFTMLVVGLERYNSIHGSPTYTVSPTVDGEPSGYEFKYTPQLGYTARPFVPQ